ncbi:hypothetical protein F5Y05DRAFT_280801 [Hypoxylon sp. FL0543]|nr:hypothetical protein F5Y05DRAFT_280801 [Hypoxylon sp. FL0543]
MSSTSGTPTTGQPSNVNMETSSTDRTAQLYYNLDDPSLVTSFNEYPMPWGPTRTSCYFRSASLRPLGIWFRDLSEYGEVVEEGPEKLVIRLTHREPGSLLMVVWCAWVAKYLADGTLCTMEFEPLMPYQPVEVVFQNLEWTGPPISSTSPTTHGQDAAVPPSEGQQPAPQHPLVDYNYSNELNAQLAQIWAVNPAMFPMGPLAFQGHQMAPPYQEHQDAQYPSPPGNQTYRGGQGGGSNQHIRGQQGHRGPSGRSWPWY